MKKFLALIAILSLSPFALPCSSAIISGKASPDGRPILWKHRDSREDENELRWFHGDHFDFIGLVETRDTTGTQVWMGANNAGLAIINTNSYNLEKGRYRRPMDQDGFLMKEVLGSCGALEDFEQYLRETTGKRGVTANFGLIDARGGAAYYEVDPFHYVKYDANDSHAAPSGYLIRANFGFSGKKGEGAGYIRYQTLDKLFYWTNLDHRLNVEFLLMETTRCLKHDLLQIDLAHGNLPENSNEQKLVLFRDYVVRFDSVSSMVIQGVKKDEDPRLTTIWTIPGFPLTTLTVPTWVAAGENLPQTVRGENKNPSFLAKASLSLKQKCFPLRFREGKDYLNLSCILNRENTGILQIILEMDRENIRDTLEMISEWRTKGFNKTEAQQYYIHLDQMIKDFYSNYFEYSESGD
ncbi:hypothetical protein JW926_08510 [Candidatus Sumerlaeota bacterium]|nr:hypothetical protein [Candidatus Sumerlaeota bacterium]